MTKFFRAIKIAFQYMYRNFGLSFASIVVMTLSFFIVSIVGIAFYGSFELVKYVDSKPQLIIFLKGDLTDSEEQEFKDIVNSTGLVTSVDVKDESYKTSDFAKRISDQELVDKISKDDVKKYISRLAFVSADKQENLQKLITILEKNDKFVTTMLDKINIEQTGWYVYDSDLAKIIKDTNNLITVAGGIVTIFLFVISAILIFITVKLTINYHKRELEIMDLVGADGWFIRLPFVVGGIIYGVLGAVLSTTFILLFKNLVLQTSQSLVPRLTQFFGQVPWPDLNTSLIIELYAVTILAGALVGAVSSFFAILRYVKK